MLRQAVLPVAPQSGYYAREDGLRCSALEGACTKMLTSAFKKRSFLEKQYDVEKEYVCFQWDGPEFKLNPVTYDGVALGKPLNLSQSVHFFHL